MKIRHIFLMLIALVISSIAFADSIGGNQKKQIEKVVHDYLIQNPEVLVQAMQVLQQKQMEQAQKSIEKTQQLGPQYANELFHNSQDPIVGNPNGNITLVEFFDYQCPHCTMMESVLEETIKANPDLRVIYKEFPIRGSMSNLGSRAALAAKMQNKYVEFHNALMVAGQQLLTEDVIYKVAQSVGLDVDKLKKDMNDKAISDQIKVNIKLGQQLQLLGTPAFFVAKSDVKQNASSKAVTFIPGQVDKEQLQKVLQEVRK